MSVLKKRVKKAGKLSKERKRINKLSRRRKRSGKLANPVSLRQIPKKNHVDSLNSKPRNEQLLHIKENSRQGRNIERGGFDNSLNLKLLGQWADVKIPKPAHLPLQPVGVVIPANVLTPVTTATDKPLVKEERRVYLVGTVHVSKESARKVEEVIATVLPDMVCLELDFQRFQGMVAQMRLVNENVNLGGIKRGERETQKTLSQKSKPNITDSKMQMQHQKTQMGRGVTSAIDKGLESDGVNRLGRDEIGEFKRDLVKESKGLDEAAFEPKLPNLRELLTLPGLLKWMQQEIGREFGVMPGTEMVSAYKTARRYGICVGVIDRPLDQTTARMWNVMPFGEKIKLIGYIGAVVGVLFLKPLFGNKIMNILSTASGGGEINIKNLESGEGISELMKELKMEFPSLYETLVNERNFYMCNNIKHILQTRAKTIVVVIGLGHLKEMKEMLAKEGVSVFAV